MMAPRMRFSSSMHILLVKYHSCFEYRYYLLSTVFAFIIGASWDKVCDNACVPVRPELFVSTFWSPKATWSFAAHVLCRRRTAPLHDIQTRTYCVLVNVFRQVPLTSLHPGWASTVTPSSQATPRMTEVRQDAHRPPLATLFVWPLHPEAIPCGKYILKPYFTLTMINSRQTGRWFVSFRLHYHRSN